MSRDWMVKDGVSTDFDSPRKPTHLQVDYSAVGYSALATPTQQSLLVEFYHSGNIFNQFFPI